MKDSGWKGFALAAVTGVLLGGGVSGFYADAKIQEVEDKLDAEVLRLELRDDKDYDVLMEISRALVRIETKVDALQEE